MYKKILFVSLLSLVLTPLTMAQQPNKWELEDGASMTLPTSGEAGYSLIKNSGPGPIIVYYYHYELDRHGNKIKVLDSVIILKKGEFNAEQLQKDCGIDIADWSGDGKSSEGYYWIP